VSDQPDGMSDYLDALATRLVGPRAHVDRLLDEVGEHLADAVEAAVAAGADPEAARRKAIERFGPVDVVVRSMNGASRARYRRRAAGELAVAVTGVTAAGLVAMGATGVVAAIGARLTSTDAVFGLPVGARMPTSSCAHWLSVQPTAASCRQAATMEAASDLTLWLAVAGLLGLAVVVAFVLMRRSLQSTGLVPASTGPSLSATAFAVGAAGAAALAAANAVIGSTWGAGLFWSAAVTCAIAALVSGALVLQSRRSRPGARGAVAR